MSGPASGELAGIYPIVPTPFDEAGRLDLDSVRRLAVFVAACGAQGPAVLGVMGEGQKLSEREREQLVETMRGALPPGQALVVGMRAAGTDLAVEAAQRAAALGADAILLGPPPVQNDEALFHYYRRVAEALAIPVIIHDYPASTGILLSTALMARIHEACANASYVKLEDPPTGPKMARLREAAGPGLRVLGALGGLYALEELQRGAVGIMTGFAYPELLVEINRRFRAGDVDGAATVFYDILPLIRFEFQPGLGVHLRKYILVQRGVFRTATVRHPGAVADGETLAQLERILIHLRNRGYAV